MAVYKVPQDVEADDKLIGPFSFRQFVYLLIAAGLIAVGVALFQMFPLLAIIPLPPVLLLLALALPLKKDQPMETYLVAVVSYYLKPRTRRWMPGQKETTIRITAPKIVEDVRTRDLSEEEATHRLSFLADIVDSQGYAIKGISNNNMRDDLVAEAAATADMFDSYKSGAISRAIDQDQKERHEEVIRSMREAIERSEADRWGAATVMKDSDTNKVGSQRVIKPLTSLGAMEEGPSLSPEPTSASVSEPASVPEQPMTEIVQKSAEAEKSTTENVAQNPPKDSIIELANNSDFTVATIAKEANRIKRKDEGEVFISLH